MKCASCAIFEDVEALDEEAFDDRVARCDECPALQGQDSAAAIIALLARQKHTMRALRRTRSKHRQVSAELIEVRSESRAYESRLARLAQVHKASSAEIERINIELQEATGSLIETSRLAGMAEVTTGILHDIGNILNSVNVSVAMLRNQINASRGPGLEKAVALMQLQGDQLVKFIEQDERGRRLPHYLGRLAERMVSDRAEMLAELARLGSCVEAVNEVIAVQQSLARVSGVREAVFLVEVVDDVLRMNRPALLKFSVRVERKFDSLPKTVVERSKVMRIINNLISNAIDAMAESSMGGGAVLSLSLVRDGELQHFSAQDTGVGICGDSLIDIFTHGFTTKKDGHGFGLHHSANTARELGGRLWASSEGVGLGATFHLTIPLAFA